MPHRDFPIPEPTDPDPISFTLGPRRFTCLPEVPMAARLLISSAMVRKVDLVPFVQGVLTPDCDLQWGDALADKGHIVGQQLTEDLFWWLVEQYAERTGEAPLATRVPDPVPAAAAPPADPTPEG